MILNQEQLELKNIASEFSAKEITPISMDCDKTMEFPINAYKKAFAMGLHCLELPQEYGGGGQSNVNCVAVLEELGKADAGFATTIGAIFLSSSAVFSSGTSEQKKKYADIIVPGAFSSFCLTETGAGSNPSEMRTTAKKVGDEYIINGTKTFITNGGVSDIYIVVARTHDKPGVEGLSAFLVEREREGLFIGKTENKMGIRLSNTSDVIFNEVRIPASNLLGEEGQGFEITMEALSRSRAIAFAAAVGLCQAAIDHSTKYARERSTFQKPIAAFQSIQTILADMEIQTQAARNLIYHAAELVDAGLPYAKYGAIAKCFAADTAVKVSSDAVQIFGGYGYSQEYPVEKLMRDSKIFQIMEGTNQIQRMLIAQELFKEDSGNVK